MQTGQVCFSGGEHLINLFLQAKQAKVVNYKKKDPN